MGLKLSISNIAWSTEYDSIVYAYLKHCGFLGIEIAPTRIIPERPYEKITEATAFSEQLRSEYNLNICSLQSIWYGRTECIFKSEYERNILIDYTNRAVDFASAIGARNLVFGCPKNRCITNTEDIDTAIDFFKTICEYAEKQRTVISLEANPVIYGTNFINRTSEAISLIQKVNSKAFMLNLDFGTMLYNEESIDELIPFTELINHVHISEPCLGLIEKRNEHRELFDLLRRSGYDGYISIEMGRREDVDDVLRTIDYIREL